MNHRWRPTQKRDLVDEKDSLPSFRQQKINSSISLKQCKERRLQEIVIYSRTRKGGLFSSLKHDDEHIILL
jgi:hypothetical protein